MTEQLLIATIAGQRVALRTSTVQSMIEVETVTPVPRTSAHIAGLSALRSRVLTVIDCRCALGLAQDEAPPTSGKAVVVEHGGHFYALLVENVEDVVEARSTPLPVNVDIGRGWEHVSLGMIEAGDETLLLVDAAKFIAGQEEVCAD